MKTIESKIAPNPKEAQIWVDLSADAHGTVRKIWNGKKWVTNSNDNSEVVKVLSNEISELQNKINSIVSQFNTQLNKLNNTIVTLNNRIIKLEKVQA